MVKKITNQVPAQKAIKGYYVLIAKSVIQELVVSIDVPDVQ